MKRPIILHFAILLTATAVKSAGQSLPGLYFTNALVLSNGCGQFEVRTPEAAKPYVLLYSYAKDFCYLRDSQRWSVWMALNSVTNRYIITSPQPMSATGTIFFRAAPLGQPMYWLDYEISSFGTLTNRISVVTWPKQPDRWWADLTVQNGTNFPAAGDVFFTGPPGTLTNTPTQNGGGSGYKRYYDVLGPGTVPPAGTWHVQYATQALTFPMPDPQVGSRYVVMVPNVVVSNDLLTSVSWTYRNPTTGAVLAAVPDYVAGSRSVTVSDINDDTIYDSPPADRSRINHVFASPIVWSDVGWLNIGFHDNLGNEFLFGYHK